MRTKTLLLAAAAVAAGLASSQAQSNVYSVNIVGYINVPLTTAKTLLANPLDNGTNDIVSIDNGIIPNKSSIQLFTGTGFSLSSKANGTWNSDPVIPAGGAFFITAKSACTLTFVGSAPTTNNYALTTTKSMIGAIIPISGALTDAGVNSLNLGASLPNKSSVQIFTPTGYVLSSKANGTWNVPITIPVAGGFFVSPKAAATWAQGLQ